MMLPEAVLSIFMIGVTHYVDIGKEADAAIYYADADTAYMRLAPDGPVMTGSWRLQDGGYFVAWQDGPQAQWYVDADAGRFTYLDAEHQPRGTVTRFVPGDPEGFAE